MLQRETLFLSFRDVIYTQKIENIVCNKGNQCPTRKVCRHARNPWRIVFLYSEIKKDVHRLITQWKHGYAVQKAAETNDRI